MTGDDATDRPHDIRPVVASEKRPVPGWVFGAALALLAIVLFLVLDSRRRALQAPAVRAPIDLSGGAPPPVLTIPPDYAPPPLVRPVRAIAPSREPAPVTVPPPAPRAAPYAPAPPAPSPYMVAAPEPARPAPPASSAPILVLDQGNMTRAAPVQDGPAPDAAGAPPSGRTTAPPARARAGRFANAGTTVAQGTLIPAVLETALDSTRAGFARAIVSRDVRGFDGARILIPRGSRLIGEYDSEAAPGQNRALITWTRLIRPDGATVALESPVTDTLGRTGVRARVNSHFWQRFSGAILQSVLDIGVNVAGRAIDAPAVIALPGAFGGAPQRVEPQQVTPTLSVKRGTSVSVFVARDLDFTGVEGAAR